MSPIVVVGSLNMDIVVRVSRFPQAGETVMGLDFATMAGGKGGNQAYAAARLGANVRMIGRVGSDAFGQQLVDGLRLAGVDVSRVGVAEGRPSGIALITLDAAGQNHIVVSTGANAQLTAADVDAGLDDVDRGFLLIQLESPVDAIDAAIRIARQKGLTVILDPAPARVLSPEWLSRVDVLTPNQSEAMTLIGAEGGSVSLGDAPRVASALRDQGVAVVVLKLGEHGAMLADRRGTTHYAGARTPVLDTTAAGDTFNGALAVALSEGMPFDRAIPFANAAAALSVARHGAQASMPGRDELGVVSS